MSARPFSDLKYARSDVSVSARETPPLTTLYRCLADLATPLVCHTERFKLFGPKNCCLVNRKIGIGKGYGTCGTSRQCVAAAFVSPEHHRRAVLAGN